jgi:hypothetical protein
MQTPASLTVIFCSLAVLVAALAAGGAALAPAADGVPGPARRAPRLATAAAVAAAWMAIWIVVARSGALLQFQRRPPPLLLMMVATVAAGVALGASPLGARLSRLPLALLVGFQAFRLPLELVMHGAARAGAMPVQMSFAGWNFDVVTGASAVIVAGLVASGRAPRALVMAWNAVGIALLAIIGAIAVASTPLVHAFGTDPAVVNTWVGEAPFVWLPTVFVTLAIAGHVVVTRRLLRERRVPAA